MAAEISPGVYMLSLDFHGNLVHPMLLREGEMSVLIDTGFPGQIEDLRAAMNAAGVPLAQLQAVILTHQDMDHIGCLPEILQECGPRVKIYAHALDQPYIQGELPLLKDSHL
ncbi:MBL fold metallo-hydrolase, partial [Mesorhizobium sp. M00.F.Ca.ET.186.01.1.1]